MEFSRQEYWSGLPFPPPGHCLQKPQIQISPSSLTRTLSTLTLSPWFITTGIGLVLYKHERAYHRLDCWQSFPGTWIISHFFFFFNSVCSIFPETHHPDGIVGPTFPLSWDPSWLKLAQGLASLHSYVTSVESSIPLLAYLPVNIFEANLELTLSMIISNKNIHKVLVTKQSSILCLICITMWQNIL